MFTIGDHVESKESANHDIEGRVINIQTIDDVEMAKVNWTLGEAWVKIDEIKMYGEKTIYNFEKDISIYNNVYIKIKEAFVRYCEEDGITDWYKDYEMITFETNDYNIILVFRISTDDERKEVVIPKSIFVNFYED